MLDIHCAAASGFAKGAATYVKGRPDYPPDVGDWLHTDLALSKGKTVLDLGAGTGKFIPSLRATGATIIAVEPVPAMLAQLAELNPGITAKQGGMYPTRRCLSRCRRLRTGVSLVRAERSSQRNPSRLKAGRRSRADMECAR
jgi:SAM-dependent methyltransferase